ncbi:MAG TPA: hypothetical protein VHW64_03880 [Nocardioides sp.]|jgi:hypothetical protein|uniref:hypothetical protein n=1 Tax=Nocardioides sp. TaxID=35761 RepID=UPI002E321D4C|nr:hypothetical protein [Nocardioides sp.]HEX3929816.1 hypothetical protein [Nocardioides sp.]
MKQFVHFSDKAMGWLLVAAGAFRAPGVVRRRLLALLVAMLLVALGYAVYRMRRSAFLTGLEHAAGR